jgi:hypothetical protein
MSAVKKGGQSAMDKAKIPLWVTLIIILGAGALYLSLQRDRPQQTGGPNDASDRSIRMMIEVKEIDINSGDLRCQEYSSGQLIRTTISESPLSKEIRRLELVVPSERDWRFLNSKQSDGVYADGIYGFAPSVGNRLVQLLDEAYASDEVRRAMLTKFMKSLQTDDWQQAKQAGNILLMEAKARAGKAGQ